MNPANAEIDKDCRNTPAPARWLQMLGVGAVLLLGLDAACAQTVGPPKPSDKPVVIIRPAPKKSAAPTPARAVRRTRSTRTRSTSRTAQPKVAAATEKPTR